MHDLALTHGRLSVVVCPPCMYLQAMVEQRLLLFPHFMKLSGRLELVLSQIQSNQGEASYHNSIQYNHQHHHHIYH